MGTCQAVRRPLQVENGPSGSEESRHSGVVSAPGWALNWLRKEHLLLLKLDMPTNRHIRDYNLITSSYMILNRQRYNFHFQKIFINNDRTQDI